MKNFLRLILWALFCNGAFLHAKEVASLTNWTRAIDQKSIEARLVSFDIEANQVMVKMQNGRVYDITFSALIPEHQSRLENIHKEREEQKEAPTKARMETFTPEGGGGHKVHVYKPANYIDGDPSNKNRPVAFLYSPGGKSKSIIQRVKMTSDELGWLLVGVDGYKNTPAKRGVYEGLLKKTTAAYDWAVDNLVFDEKKVVFGGFSGGAWWSYQSASKINKKTAGILAFGGWMSNMHSQRYSKNMAVALINGDNDKGALRYEDVDSKVLKRKARAKLKVYHFSGGHSLPPREVVLEAARWIHETKKFGDLR